jgi:hypothetical protein
MVFRAGLSWGEFFPNPPMKHRNRDKLRLLVICQAQNPLSTLKIVAIYQAIWLFFDRDQSTKLLFVAASLVYNL